MAHIMNPVPAVPPTAEENAGLFHAVLKSLKEFNDIELKNVIQGLINPTDRENCFLACYTRAAANVDTLLDMTHVRNVQAIAMLARTMIEIAADIRLIDVIQDAVPKILIHTQIEKLKAAQRVTSYASNHTLGTPVHIGPYQEFIAKKQKWIDAEADKLWPGVALKYIGHWSRLDMAARVQLLKEPLEEQYELFYRMLSWQVHAGATGIMGLPKETFVHLCTLGFSIGAVTFEEILKATAAEFKLSAAIEALDKKMEFAKYCPLTKGENEEELQRQIKHELGL
jgi:hypothetical protein